MKIIRVLNLVVDLLILALILALLAFGGYSVWNANQIYSKADSSNYSDWKPGEGSSVQPQASISFSELTDMNPDVLGWIEVYGTGIDYPFVQGDDNDEYINQAVDGSFSLSGSLFLDAANARDFTDFQTVIYGHHMDRHGMFGDLDQFTEESYFKSHRYGTLYYSGKQHGLEIFAMLEADARDGVIYGSSPVTAADRENWLTYIRTHAKYFRDPGMAEGDHVVVLSTCADRTTKRYVVMAKITDSVKENPFGKEGDDTMKANGVSKRKSGLFLLATLLLLALAAGLLLRSKAHAAPVAAGDDGTTPIPVTQEFVYEDTGNECKETGTYQLKMVSRTLDGGALSVSPDTGATDVEFVNLQADGTFTLTGNETKKLELTFKKAGAYAFELTQVSPDQENYTYDRSTYQLVYYVKNVDGGLQVTAVLSEEDGTEAGSKVDKALFGNSTSKEDPNKPTPTPTPTPDQDLPSPKPNTGDAANATLWGLLLASAISLLGAATLHHRRSER